VFARFRFPVEVIVVAVRWYLRYGLSYRDVEELLAERGIEVDHVTVYRWVQRFTPLLADAARFARHSPGDRTAQVVIAGHAFVQNLRRGHYDIELDTPPATRLAAAFARLARAI
jgi:transposase-like protein